MERCRILASGWWSESDVSVIWSDRFFHLPTQWQAEADAFWDGQQSRGYFNGKMARLGGWRVQDHHLHIELETTDYKTLLFGNHCADILAEGYEAVLSGALGVSALVRSSDGQLVLMKRSAQVGEYPLCYDLFGGHIDAGLQSGRNSLFRAMERELEEELGLPASRYTLHCFGLLETCDRRKPELLFAAHSRHTAAELGRLAENARDAHEFEHILILADDKRAINVFLHDHDTISPSAYGCLFLYSQLRVTHERQAQAF